MASVTVYSAAKVDELTDAAVTGASIVDGHLNLTLGDDSTVDVGSIVVSPPVATTTTTGVVELATDTETIAGTDSTRAVTPLGVAALTATLNTVKIATGILETALPSSYPTGVSTMVLTASAWSLNSGAGTVVTNNIATDRCSQTFYFTSGGSQAPRFWIREYHSSNGGGGWTVWSEVTTTVTLTAASFVQTTAFTAYPKGYTRLYYTTANSGNWDFTGLAGEVITYSDGTDFAKQVFTQHVGGSTATPDFWVRTANSTSGWSAWLKMGGDTGWVNLTYASGFVAGTAGQIQYRVRHSVVYVRGGGQGTFAAGAYTNIVNPGGLPAAYCPTQNHRSGAMGSTMLPCGYEINTDGSIKLGWNGVSSTPTWIALMSSWPI